MAKIDLKFLDFDDSTEFIRVNNDSSLILISGIANNGMFSIILDKSTAIKFAKTLRTEINKIG